MYCRSSVRYERRPRRARCHHSRPRQRRRANHFDQRFSPTAGSAPEVETNLKPDELIISIDLPASPYAAHSHYLKVRDRASYEFALVSVAAALEVDGETIRSARIALGGVAHKPWRAESAEQLLVGKKLSADLFEAAG